jgi:integrase
MYISNGLIYVVVKRNLTVVLNQNKIRNGTLENYITNISTMNKSTAYEYLSRLNNFKTFITKHSNLKDLDHALSQIHNKQKDPYHLLNSYCAYLVSTHVSASYIKNCIITVKNFFEYYDVELSPRKFKMKIKLPRVVKRSKEAISKEDIVDILNFCSDIRLKTYVMLLASTGMRAVEALSIRIKDVDLQSNPSNLFIRGEYTKTKSDRIIFLTSELSKQISSWVDYKYRKRRICYSRNNKAVTEYRTPEKKDTDLLFAVHQSMINPNPKNLYHSLVGSFGKTLDRIGKGEREDSNERRREITLHSFRRFVKTTISDLGYRDFSEYFIGHSGSTYWTKKESEKAEIFQKIEPYLTFLNVHQLERQGADIRSRVDELEELNDSLRERDKTKDDAIAQLSDQLMTLTVRLQEIERRQNVY